MTGGLFVITRFNEMSWSLSGASARRQFLHVEKDMIRGINVVLGVQTASD